MVNDPEPTATAYEKPQGPSGWVPAALLGVVLAFGGAWLATRLESFGYAFLVGLPIVVGFELGYCAWTKGLWLSALIATVLASTFGLVMTQNLGGALCGLITCAIVIVPLTVGAIIGHLLRKRHFARFQPGLLATLIALLPIGLWMEAELTPPHGLETITTARVLPMPPGEAWAAAAFYADVPLERPRLLRIGLPTPIGTTGRQDQVGAIVTCVYEDAHITKRMTQVEPGKVLAFDVLEQSGVEDRSVALRHGAFRFEPLAGGRTRVTLSSTYTPLLDARWAWRPFEQLICHELHDHILDGMEAQPKSPQRNATSEPGSQVVMR